MVGHTRTKAVFCVDCGKRFSSGQAGGITYHRYTALMHLFLMKILFPPTAIFLILILLLIRFDPDSIRSARSGSVQKSQNVPKEKNLKKIMLEDLQSFPRIFWKSEKYVVFYIKKCKSNFSVKPSWI
jgi:hypothetical protein